MTERLEPVIGLEVHVQLRTGEKLFSAAPARFGSEPNTNVDPVTLGLPGALPVLNGEAVDLAIRTAFGLGATVHAVSVFARKNYFYPDLPKGYQISQFDQPLATGGTIALHLPDDHPDSGVEVRLRRLHMEEDAGKSIHDRFRAATAVDLNRAGVPLVEIVSEPDIPSPAAARAYLDELKLILEYLDVSDCNMEEGSLRVDANISVRPVGSTGLGTKTELKNMNSFSGVERALEVEIARQVALVGAGGSVEHQTLLWDERRGTVRPMRSKEESHDYRYFADPDLPPLVLDEERLDRIRAGLPELPRARRARFRSRFGLADYDAGVLTSSRTLADYFEALIGEGVAAKSGANWIMGPVLELVNQAGITVESWDVASGELAELIGLVDDGTISHGTGKGLLARLWAGESGPARIVESESLAQVGDLGVLTGWVAGVLDSNPDEVTRYKAGEKKLMGFFVGGVMRESGGKADPREVNRLLRQALSED